MKRTMLAALAAIGVIFGSTNSANAQVEQGSIMIDPYVGFPTANIWWANLFDLDETENYSTIGSPVSFGGRFEYMVADNFGLGLDANYAIAGFQYDDPYYDLDSTGNWVSGTYKYSSKKLRIMFRANYHFVQTENVDVYVGVGAGYKHVTRTAEWNGEEDLSSITGSLLPVAFRVALGGRYYFHPNIGINFELGAGGGGILQAGLAVKI